MPDSSSLVAPTLLLAAAVAGWMTVDLIAPQMNPWVKIALAMVLSVFWSLFVFWLGLLLLAKTRSIVPGVLILPVFFAVYAGIKVYT